MDPVPLAARAAIFAVFGLVVGSFLTVVIHRVPRRESIVRPRSRCPLCDTELRPRDNLPVVGWVLLRGRCRACGERISPLYPLVELGTAALFASAAVWFERILQAALVAPFLALMLALAVIDARHRIVPNRITYPAVPLFAAAILAGHVTGQGVSILHGLVGAVLYAGPLFLVALALPGGMGMGDVKLAALIGLVLGSLGLRYVAVAAALGVIGGGLGAGVAVTILRRSRKEHIPFGPFLAMGAGAAAFATPQVASAYLSLLS